jgi:hypothetical protein
MKDMTDDELLDAIDSAMKTVAERFRVKREAQERAAADRTSAAEQPVPAAGPYSQRQ